ncbi:MAG: hypothetical protein HGA43_14875 [Nitrospirae bacterium]|nr:hypothetical protein [Nitrospirota bacterium]
MKFAIDKGRMLTHQRAWWELPHFFKLLVGGFGCGKTHIGALRMLYLSYINRPYPVLYVSPTYPQARRTIAYTLETILSGARVRYDYNRTHHEFFMPGWKGTIWIASGEIPNSLKGPNVAAAGIDEPFIQSKETFDVVISRVRENKAMLREIFLTGTPEQLNWGYDVAMNDAGAYDLGLIIGRTGDNHHLPPDFVERLRSAYDENQQAAYLDGIFVNLTKGRVYSYFDRHRHIDRQEIGSEQPVFAGIDFNVDFMSAELFIINGKQVHFFDEIRLNDSDTFALAERLKENYPGITVYPDASGNSRKTSAKKTDHTILRDADFRVIAPARNPAVRDRVNAVQGKLRRGELTIGNCPHLIKDLERVVWKNGEIDKLADKALTHASDAAGYPINYLFPVRIEKPYEQPSHWSV